MKLNYNIKIFFLFLLIIQANSVVHGLTLVDCLQSITQNSELSSNPRHPENYFFSKVSGTKDQFLLIQQSKNYLCKTEVPLAYDSNIDILTTLPNLKEPRRIYYSQRILKKEKPQTKSLTVPQENGFLPPHAALDSAVEIAAAMPGARNSARCEITSDFNLVNQQFQKTVQAEVQDIYPDFAEQRDSLAYNYDIKESEKIKNRNTFDTQLKKIVELCGSIPELKSVSASVARKIESKSAVRFNILNASPEPSRSKVKLPSEVKQ